MIFNQAFKFRLLLLGVIIIWALLDTPDLNNTLANGLVVGGIFFILARWVDYQIGRQLRDFVLIVMLGVAVAIFANFAFGYEYLAVRLAWSAYVIVGYGIAGIAVCLFGWKRNINSKD